MSVLGIRFGEPNPSTSRLPETPLESTSRTLEVSTIVLIIHSRHLHTCDVLTCSCVQLQVNGQVSEGGNKVGRATASPPESHGEGDLLFFFTRLLPAAPRGSRTQTQVSTHCTCEMFTSRARLQHMRSYAKRMDGGARGERVIVM